MKPLLYLTLVASFAGGFFGGVFLAAGEYQFSTLFLIWSWLDLAIAFYLIDKICKPKIEL